MRRLVLLVIAGVLVTTYLPDSRAWLADMLRPLWAPVVRWNTEQEMAQVGRDVVGHEVQMGRLPDRRNWIEWLDWRYPVDDLKLDAWGSTYQLRVWADSVAIVSWGPDRIRNTEDDFQVSTPRERRRRR